MDLVDVVIEDGRWEDLGLAPLAERAARAVASHLGLAPGEAAVCLMGCDDARIAALNAEFRGKPTPTNVLSWPSEERGPSAPGGEPPRPDPQEEWGDVALAWETCQREAAEAGIPPAAHVTHLVVHGILHLLGYDHIDDRDAAVMERHEVAILATLGIDDPY